MEPHHDDFCQNSPQKRKRLGARLLLQANKRSKLVLAQSLREQIDEADELDWLHSVRKTSKWALVVPPGSLLEVLTEICLISSASLSLDVFLHSERLACNIDKRTRLLWDDKERVSGWA